LLAAKIDATAMAAFVISPIWASSPLRFQLHIKMMQIRDSDTQGRPAPSTMV
jgi:hypothetical protein